MKNGFRFFAIFILCFCLTSCQTAQKTPESSASSENSVETVVDISNDSFAGAHQFYCAPLDWHEVKVPLGQVEIFSGLRERLNEFNDEDKLAVMICFASMIRDDWMEKAEIDGINAAEYYRIYTEKPEDSQISVREALYRYSALQEEHFYAVLDSLSYSGPIKALGGTCVENYAFYTCMTKAELLALTCNEDEAFYIFAAQYK